MGWTTSRLMAFTELVGNVLVTMPSHATHSLSTIGDNTMASFQVFKDIDKGEQCWHWRLLVNGSNVAESKDPKFRDEILAFTKKSRKEMAGASVYDQAEATEGKSRIEYHSNENEDDMCEWCCKSDGDEVIAIGKTEVPKEDAISNLEDIFSNVGDADITWEDERDDPANQAKADDRTVTKGIPGSY